jgi:phenylpyruvate tautomerase PptA (4-oxalocrotonate tautomerase family)
MLNSSNEKENQMPTFTCYTAPKKLTLTQKAEIANLCTNIYHEEFGIARYLIQVIFQEFANGDQYIAGQPAPDVVWIQCYVRAGRDEELKGRLLHRVQQAVAKTANVPEESVWFYLTDIPAMNIMEWGHIMPRPRPAETIAIVTVTDPRVVPHDDEHWFEDLSEAFKARLRALPTSTEYASTEGR